MPDENLEISSLKTGARASFTDARVTTPEDT